jgi:UrcA family protein
MSCLIKSAALLAALTFTAPAALADKPVAMEVVVSYGDLNLQNREGIDILFSRIARASRKVCGGRPAHIMNGALTRFLACRNTTIGNTVRRIDIPSVTIAWAEQSDEMIRIASR